MNEFVLDTAAYGIERAKEDYDKGLFRNENEDSFKKFFRSRIISAFNNDADYATKDYVDIVAAEYRPQYPRPSNNMMPSNSTLPSSIAVSSIIA